MSQRRPSRWRSTPDLQLNTERATEFITSLQARLEEAETTNAKLQAQQLTQRVHRSANLDHNELLKICQGRDYYKEKWEEARSTLEELQRQCDIKDQSYTELWAVTNSLQRKEKSLLEEKRLAEKTLEDAKHTWDAEKHHLLNRESETRTRPGASETQTPPRRSKKQEGQRASVVDALNARILLPSAEIAKLEEDINNIRRDRDKQREVNNENRMTIANLRSGMDRIVSLLDAK